MIKSGIDGLSQGDLDTGLMSGASPLAFVSLHQSLIEHNPRLELWIMTWMPSGTSVLTPEGWFGAGHSGGPWIWDLAPAAADFALDQFCIGRHKDPNVFHVVFVPQLFTSRWWKQLIKIADLVFTFPLDFPLWDKTYHEPLLISLVYPLHFRFPWQY